MTERWLVTGALGCIGSWVVDVLLGQQVEVTTFDVDVDGRRLDLVVGGDRLSGVRRLKGDIRDFDAVRSAIEVSRATHVVHLAALQIPFCRANPPLGAEVNVVGTVNVFEAAARSDGQVRGLSYASSAAAYDALDSADAGRHGDLPGVASTIYGVYKRANEGTAQVYWQVESLASVGLRPHTVYGPGRDQGVTSQPTQAILAAVRGEPFHIGFGGLVPMQYARDVAGDFVDAARAAVAGAPVLNTPGSLVSVPQIIDAIVAEIPAAAGSIDFTDEPLPFPGDLPIDTTVFTPAPRTSLADGVRASIEKFRHAEAR